MALIVVSGALANKHLNGGEAWLRLSWIEGFVRLGHEVHFVEQISAKSCVNSAGAAARFEDSINLDYFRQVISEFGLHGRATLICDDANETFGAGRADLLALAKDAALLVNISGTMQWQAFHQKVRKTAYVDSDPGFTQLWHETGTALIPKHDLYFTVGMNVGQPDCSIPACGIDWKLTRQPVVLDRWPVSKAGDLNRLTTIANWRGPFGVIEWQGKRLGLKAHEFRKFISLPSLVPQRLEIALSIHPADHADRERLLQNGWELVDPGPVSATPKSFHDYIQTSGGECSVAQGMYVDTNSGWFSDRTVRYLASGKPCLVQETGFSRHLPTGEGLIGFRTIDEAAAGAANIAQNYGAHCAAARRIAERHFASDVVLGRFLDDVGGVG